MTEPNKSMSFIRLTLSLVIALTMLCTVLTEVKAQPFMNIRDMQIANAHRCYLLLQKGDFANAHNLFDQQMKSEFPADSLKKFWEVFGKKAGRIVRQFDQKIDVDPDDSTLVTIVKSIRCSTGNWDLRFTYHNSPEIDGFYIAPFKPRYEKRAYTVPDYVHPDSVKERDIIIGKGTEWETKGTFTLPLALGKYPVIIIIHGSGPLDQDGTYVANKPYADLAWGLASRGIGVLRFPKRTREYYREIREKKVDITPDFESIQDAIAAFQAIKKHREADSNAIFFLGHGTGGTFLPKLIDSLPAIRGLVLLGAPSRPLEDVLLEQLEYVLSLDTINTREDSKRKLDKLRRQYQNVKDKNLTKDTPPERLLLDTPASYWLALRGYNPAKTLAKSGKPALILRGNRDFQSTDKDFDLWQKTLVTKKNSHLYQFIKYPDLNYLFMDGVGQSTPAEYAIYDHVSVNVIEDIEFWVKELLGKK
jgi:hypothetical protein